MRNGAVGCSGGHRRKESDRDVYRDYGIEDRRISSAVHAQVFSKVDGVIVGNMLIFWIANDGMGLIM